MSVSLISNNLQVNDPDHDGDVHKGGRRGGPLQGLIQNGQISNVNDAVSKFADRLSTQLNLSDTQKASLSELLKKDFTDFNTANKANGTTTNGKSNIKALFDKINSDIKGLLTPDQLTSFNAILSARPNHRPGGADNDGDKDGSVGASNSQQTINGIQPDGSVNALV